MPSCVFQCPACALHILSKIHQVVGWTQQTGTLSHVPPYFYSYIYPLLWCWCHCSVISLHCIKISLLIKRPNLTDKLAICLRKEPVEWRNYLGVRGSTWLAAPSSNNLHTLLPLNEQHCTMSSIWWPHRYKKSYSTGVISHKPLRGAWNRSGKVLIIFWMLWSSRENCLIDHITLTAWTICVYRI